MEFQRNCKHCGKAFVTSIAQEEFCSAKCRSVDKLKRLNAEKARNVQADVPSIHSRVSVKQHNMTITKAAEFLGLTRPTLYSYIKQGVLPCINLPGKTLIRKEDIDTLLLKVKPETAYEIDPDRYISYYQMCEKYHRCYNFVRKLCAENDLRSVFVINNIKFFEVDKVEQVYQSYLDRVTDAAQRRRECAMERRKSRFSRDYIPPEHGHDPKWYSTTELSKIYYLDRNQIYRLKVINGVRTMHVERHCLYLKEDVDRVFSITPEFDV